MKPANLRFVLRNTMAAVRGLVTFDRHVLALVVLCGVAAWSPQAAATHSWGGYHWSRTQNPFTLELGNNLSSEWQSYLETTSSDWSDPGNSGYADVLDTQVAAGGTDPKRCRPTSGRVEVCNASYGNNGWLGLAQIWVSGGHIEKGVTKLNDTYFSSGTYNTVAWRNLVMCQEVGHTLGLDHQDEDFNNVPLGTCMDYSSDPVPNQHPDAHDYEELAIIYSHLDAPVVQTGPKKGRRMPPAMSEIDFETPAQWGKIVRSLNKGMREVYELDFGGGNKVFTFVIWAEPAGRGGQ